MLSKKFGSMKKLAKKVKSIGSNNTSMDSSHHEVLLKDNNDYCKDEVAGGSSPSTPVTTPTGTFPVYVGAERQRFAVPTSYLSHPLFKMVLEKAYDEFGFDQRHGLMVPCSVAAFREVVSAVECSNGKFDFGDLVGEFL